MRFEFTTSNRIIFGPGTLEEVPEIARILGQHAFVVTASLERIDNLLKRLIAKGLNVIEFVVNNEPEIMIVEMATRIARESNCDLIIGIGGGSTLDTGKAVAALLNNPGSLLDYLEIVGSGRTFKNPSAPYIAIPTTAGTGSEVTRNAVLAIPEQHIKVSLRSPYLLPRFAIIDPLLTYSLPPAGTANTGFDALTQVIEPFVCNIPTPITDTICSDGIPRAARALLKAFNNSQDSGAREDMSLVSLYGGLALTNAQLGAVHGLASPIGGTIPAPHGAICAHLLPIVMDVNLKALHSRQPESPAIARFMKVACLLTGNRFASAEDGIVWVRNLCQDMDIRPLATYGLKVENFPMLISQARTASSMKGNPINLTDAELSEILERAI
jgi:alcohol dehydrogenase class IV